jgi:hypothetical protein
MNGRDGALPDAHVYRATIDTSLNSRSSPAVDCFVRFSQALPER